MTLDSAADVQKALVAELLGTLLFQFFVGFSKGDALAAGISYGVLRMFLVTASSASVTRECEASLIIFSAISSTVSWYSLFTVARRPEHLSSPFRPVYGTQQISGGHLNPALTLAMVAAGYFHWVTALIYIITQVLLLLLILHGACHKHNWRGVYL